MMRPLSLGFIFITMVAIAYQEPIESLQHVLVYPMEPGVKKAKREVPAVKTYNKQQQTEFNRFVEDKLIQHTQALEHLVRLAQSNQDITKQLVTAMSRDLEKPKLPERLEVQRKTRRSDVTEPPLVRFGRNVPKYGMLFKDLILAELRSDEDPVAVAEHDVANSESRRSFGSGPMVVPHTPNEKQPSPWCSVAILCRRSMDPVCGYDDNFGYGKFDDICHMLQVNCYWKYNFALVPSCKPVQ